MLQPTYTEGERRLLETADLVENSRFYNQSLYVWNCNTPACALGHYALAHPEDWKIYQESLRFRECPDRPVHDVPAAWRYFGLTEGEWLELFDGNGCGNAGTDGKRAAAYLRAFVARKVAARLSNV